MRLHFDVDKLSRIIRDLRLEEREGLSPDQYINVTLGFPKAWRAVYTKSPAFLLDILLRTRHEEWQRGICCVPTGNHRIKQVVPSHFTLHEELKSHFRELSRFVHVASLDVTNPDFEIRFQPGRFDLWYRHFQSSCLLITKVLMSFHTLRTEGSFRRIGVYSG